MKDWVHGRVALIGDAAHSFSPSTLRGAGLVIEDGYQLVSSLTSPLAEKNSLEITLKSWQYERQKRVFQMEKEANSNNQYDHRVLGSFRESIRDFTSEWLNMSFLLKMRSKPLFSFEPSQ